MKVVAISGWKFSGKDAVAEYLKDTKNFYHTKFAHPLKVTVAEKYNLELEQLDDVDLKEAPLPQYPVSPRDIFSLGIAQLLYKEFKTIGGSQAIDYYEDPSGAFLGVMGRHVEQLYWTPRALMILEGSKERAVNSQYWTDKLIEEVKECIDDPFWLDMGDGIIPAEGIVISDLRYKAELEGLRQAFGKDLISLRINRFDSTNSEDSSERDLDNYTFDVVINNKGSVEELHKEIEEKLCDLLGEN